MHFKYTHAMFIYCFQILASEIDFWQLSLSELKARQLLGVYPPCFVLSISGASAHSSCRLDVSFSGGNRAIKVQIPLETGEYLPRISTYKLRVVGKVCFVYTKNIILSISYYQYM